MSNVLERLHRRVMFAIGRGRVNFVNDSGPVQKHQLELVPTGQSTRDDTPRLGEFGHASVPPAGSDVVIVCLGGDLSQAMIIATNHQDLRLKGLQEGDSALYDSRGAYVWLQDGKILIDAAGGDVEVQNADTVTVKAQTKVRLETPLLEVTGDVVDNCGSNSKSLKDLRVAYDAHKHTGVTAGTGSSGLTDHNV